MSNKPLVYFGELNYENQFFEAATMELSVEE